MKAGVGRSYYPSTMMARFSHSQATGLLLQTHTKDDTNAQLSLWMRGNDRSGTGAGIHSSRSFRRLFPWNIFLRIHR